jgi:hypothetical protein
VASWEAVDEGRQGVHLISSRLTAGHIVRKLAGTADGGNVRTHRYRITIGGGLGRLTCQAFEDFNIEVNGVHTSLTADLDQAALYGVLYRIQSFGLELVELTRIAAVS